MGLSATHKSAPTSQQGLVCQSAQQQTLKDAKRIPAATYFCRQDENPQIEKAHEIFRESLAGKDSYLAIEIEILTSRPKISKPLNELRVAAL